MKDAPPQGGAVSRTGDGVLEDARSDHDLP
jgi:hypothetical protein